MGSMRLALSAGNKHDPTATAMRAAADVDAALKTLIVFD